MKEKTIYTDNHVTNELIEEVKEALKEYDTVNVCFDVTGRTCHMILSGELAEKMQDYDFEIEYNYGCKIQKRGGNNETI